MKGNMTRKSPSVLARKIARELCAKQRQVAQAIMRMGAAQERDCDYSSGLGICASLSAPKVERAE